MRLLLATKNRKEVEALLTEVKDPRYLPHIKKIREIKEKYTPQGKVRKPKSMVIAHAKFISQLDISFTNVKGELYFINKLRMAVSSVDDGLVQVLATKIVEQADSILTDTVKKNLNSTLLHLLTGNQLVESRAELVEILETVSTMTLNLPDALSTLIGFAEAYDVTVKEMAELLQFDYPFDFDEIQQHGIVRFHINGESYMGASW